MYFISYSYYNETLQIWEFMSEIIDIHPFDKIKQICYTKQAVLLFYKELSEEDKTFL